jgi:hypothetical protein
MIAAVNGRSAALAALLLCVVRPGLAADDLGGAARELARRIIAFAGRGEPVSITWRNLSSLSSAELAQARTTFETALRDSGLRPGEASPTVDLKLALSENQSQYLMVAEASKGEERQVWIAAWKRTTPASAPGVNLEKRLLWEQPEPILDALPNGNELVVLSPGNVAIRGERAIQTAAITTQRPWPRDLRGHLRLMPNGFRVYLPGVGCNGTFQPALTVDCRPADEPWTLDVLSRGVLLANFAATRNYFDGRVVVPNGMRKNLPSAFYTVAPVEDQGRPFWLLTVIDGRTLLLDTNLDPLGQIGPWGSDLAATEARCAGGTQVIATKAGDAREPDEFRAWSIVNRAPVAVTPPMEMPGPVTALWSLGGSEVIAVVHNLATGKYAAYLVRVVCGG